MFLPSDPASLEMDRSDGSPFFAVIIK
jgi:hypothetical protein